MHHGDVTTGGSGRHRAKDAHRQRPRHERATGLDNRRTMPRRGTDVLATAVHGMPRSKTLEMRVMILARASKQTAHSPRVLCRWSSGAVFEREGSTVGCARRPSSSGRGNGLLLPIALKRAGRRVVRRFTGLIVKRRRRESVSGPAERADVYNEPELSTVTFDDGGAVDDTGEDDGAVIGTDSRGAPSSDAPDPTAPDGSGAEPTDSAVEVSEHPTANPAKRIRLALVASALIVAVLGGLVGYLGYRGYQTRVAAHQRDLFLSVGRQAAINLTTIGYAQAEADVARILDSTTGTFHDDFQHRSQPFIDVVKRAESTSQGSVTAAGLESIDGDRAQVIVAVSVKTTNAGVPEQQPLGWRMRLDVQKVGDTAKVSDVQFVP